MPDRCWKNIIVPRAEKREILAGPARRDFELCRCAQWRALLLLTNPAAMCVARTWAPQEAVYHAVRVLVLTDNHCDLIDITCFALETGKARSMSDGDVSSTVASLSRIAQKSLYGEKPFLAAQGELNAVCHCLSHTGVCSL